MLAEAHAGNASALSTPLAQSTTDGLFGGQAVLCLDWTHSSTSLADVVYKQQLGLVTSPHTQGAS